MSTNAELLEKTLMLYKLKSRSTLINKEADLIMDEVKVLQFILPVLQYENDAVSLEKVLRRLKVIQEKMRELKNESVALDKQLEPLKNWLMNEVLETDSTVENSILSKFKICNN